MESYTGDLRREPVLLGSQLNMKTPAADCRPVNAVDCQVQAMHLKPNEEESLWRNNPHPSHIQWAAHQPKYPPREKQHSTQTTKLHNLEIQLYHNWRSRLSPLPKMRTEIRVEGDWIKTLTGENVLLRDDGDSNKILIFGTQENLLKLSELNTIYVDSTFSTCPSLFCQLFTINGFVDGQQFPLVYGFLPTKSQADYNRFFIIVKKEMQNSGLTLQSSAVMAEFELALIQAMELQFPSTTIMGCYFHFSQCLWRKVQALHLATAYSSDATVKCFIHKTTALSFVPVTFLRVAWSAIKANSPNTPGISDYTDYFESPWICGRWIKFKQFKQLS